MSAASRANSPELPQAWMVAVLGADERPVGLGVVVGTRHVVTCSHVVAEALGVKASPAQASQEQVRLKSVLSLQKAGAVVKTWYPADDRHEDRFQDICLLELTEQENGQRGIAPGPTWDQLCSGQLEPDATLSMYGYPGVDWVGIHSKGYQLGQVCQGHWWSMVEPVRRPSGFRRIERGFSGSLAWDTERDRAVGMVVGYRSGESTAYIIPCFLLRKACDVSQPDASGLRAPASVRAPDEQATTWWPATCRAS